jgi:hypothetical protein
MLKSDLKVSSQKNPTSVLYPGLDCPVHPQTSPTPTARLPHRLTGRLHRHSDSHDSRAAKVLVDHVAWTMLRSGRGFRPLPHACHDFDTSRHVLAHQRTGTDPNNNTVQVTEVGRTNTWPQLLVPQLMILVVSLGKASGSSEVHFRSGGETFELK